MLHRLTMVVLEATLCAFKVVETTRRRLRQDYPAMHGVPIPTQYLPSEMIMKCWCSNGRLLAGMPNSHAKSCTYTTSMAHDWRDAER